MRQKTFLILVPMCVMLSTGCGRREFLPPPSMEGPALVKLDAKSADNALPVDPSKIQPAPREIPKDKQPNRVELTDRAALEIRDILKTFDDKGKYLRIRVDDKLSYKLDLDPVADPDDLREVSQGINIVVDPRSAQFLDGGVLIDFIDKPGTRGFKFTARPGAIDATASLVQARAGFKTRLIRKEKGTGPPRTPPAKVMNLVYYPGPLGKMPAYLTPDPGDKKKHPAIIWIHGGDCNSIGEGSWQAGPPSNDQSASAYRNAGIVMLMPALRGGNDSPGHVEGFLGEVDDIISAASFLRQQPYVDPARIYLGGHSTGGTLALLTAECTSTFRAVFSFGPTNEIRGYGPQYLPFKKTAEELRLRSPGRWLHTIRSPTFVIEGESGNADALRMMKQHCKNPEVHFFVAEGADHFDVLAPANALIARHILRDTGPKCNLSFTAADFNRLVQTR